MGKKYIIELLDDCQSEFKGIMVFGLTQEKQISVELIPEESLTPYTEPDLGKVREKAYIAGFKDGEENAYQRGMDDANRNGEYNADDGWYVMQKISLLPNPIKTELFGTAETAVILQDNSFKDALAKLTEYEQEKEEIKVGDEVIATSGKAVVIEVMDDGQTVRYMYPDTITGRNKACSVTRTGRHFHEIAEVLQKMREGQEQ